MSGSEKITLTLPKDIMDHVRESVPARGYSKFIAEAIEYFIETKRRKELRERLINGYQVNFSVDAATHAEWEAVDDETWLEEEAMYDTTHSER